MFYNFIYLYAEQWSILNIFQYITVRAAGAFATAFILSLFIGPALIKFFSAWQRGGETVKHVAHSAESSATKAGTPTMGGVMIVVTTVFGILLWCDLLNPYVWLLLTVFIGFAAIGLLDDYCSLTRTWRGGVPGPVRLIIQGGVSCAVIYAFMAIFEGVGSSTTVYMPFFKNAVIDLGVIGFLLFGMFVIVGSANAVNLTDGLDGLVSIPVVITASALAFLAYISGRVDFTAYLNIAYIPGAGEMAIVCSALAGAGLGFLWFNAPPARIFMGDTGALPIGALLGTVAVLIKQEFAFAVIGGLFVLETVSVIVQVVSFKLTGKRVFKMAPLHHHFEKQGWPETTIVVRFWIIAILLAFVGLATLKLR